MHLFDEAALFVIGGTLGNPIQSDHATADQSRMSFARICVEIDISKPVPEEVTICCHTKEITLQIKWDKIPPYCSDCKHVGHSTSSCYAFGKRENPAKRNYHNHNFNPQRSKAQHETNGAYNMESGNGLHKENLDTWGSSWKMKENYRTFNSAKDRAEEINGSEAGFMRQGRHRNNRRPQGTKPNQKHQNYHSMGEPSKLRNGNMDLTPETEKERATVGNISEASKSKTQMTKQTEILKGSIAQQSYYATLEVESMEYAEHRNSNHMDEDLEEVTRPDEMLLTLEGDPSTTKKDRAEGTKQTGMERKGSSSPKRCTC